MIVEINDFQKKLAVLSLNQYLSALPVPPPNHPANPLDNTFDLVRAEATQLLNVLNGPGEVRIPRNSFKDTPEKVA
ncbi:hypothetical protein [Spirosoma areae]